MHLREYKESMKDKVKALLNIQQKQKVHGFLKETKPNQKIWNELLKEIKQA